MDQATLSKVALWVGGATLVAGAGAAVYTVIKAKQQNQNPTAPLLPSASAVMPELPNGLQPPVKSFTITDNNSTTTVNNGSRVDVVLPDLRANNLTWVFSSTGTAGFTTLFEINVANSSQTDFSGVAQGGAIYAHSIMVNANGVGTTLNLRYDLKDTNGAIQSTLLINLTTAS